VSGLTRGELLARTARGGVLLAVGGGVSAATTPVASGASAAIGPSDIPVVTLTVAAELLGAEFYTQALAAKVFRPNEQGYLKRALFNESEHYTAVAKILSDSGQTPGQASDFDFTFPAKAFATRKDAAALGLQLETAFQGIYLAAAKLGVLVALPAGSLSYTRARGSVSPCFLQFFLAAAKLGVLVALPAGSLSYTRARGSVSPCFLQFPHE
jgi:hypothetical protein